MIKVTNGASGLPAVLFELLTAVDLDAIEYSGRENDAESLAEWLAKGDHSMAEFMAKQMIERQQQFRHAQVHGLPPRLQALIDQVNAEQISYSGCENDAESLADWLAKGDHSMAEFMAKQIIERQQQFRHAEVHGLPPRLQALIDQVNAEKIGYSGREGDAESLAAWLAKGDHSMAEFMAKQMIERQQQFRHAQVHGLPTRLQALINQVNAERIGYNGREDDAESLADWLAKGDHSMAEFLAKQMIERQQQFRHAQVHGLPTPLQALIDQVNAERICYSGREDDAESLANWLAKGDLSMAEFLAKQMIERQRNIQDRHTNASQSN